MTDPADFPGHPGRAWFAALRPSQWAKNALLGTIGAGDTIAAEQPALL